MTALIGVDVGAMEAGRALDELVAEHVMGFVREPQHFNDGEDAGYLYVDGGVYRGAAEARVNHFSTRIGPAWEVVERMIANGWSYEIGLSTDEERHLAIFAHDDFGMVAWEDPSAPLAISKAALLALQPAHAPLTPDQRSVEP